MTFIFNDLQNSQNKAKAQKGYLKDVLLRILVGN